MAIKSIYTYKLIIIYILAKIFAILYVNFNKVLKCITSVRSNCLYSSLWKLEDTLAFAYFYFILVKRYDYNYNDPLSGLSRAKVF